MYDFQTPSPLFQPLTLPGGQTIPNRIAKAAMEENLADADHTPGEALQRLYRTWGAGGAGMLITGNVMVADDAVTGPGGVILDRNQPLAPFRKWAEAGQAGGARMWMQINHPGRQVFVATNDTAMAPSPVPVEIAGASKMFAQPRAMTEDDIARVIRQFAEAGCALP